VPLRLAGAAIAGSGCYIIAAFFCQSQQWQPLPEAQLPNMGHPKQPAKGRVAATVTVTVVARREPVGNMGENTIGGS